jgi:rod shape-determining protein MreD
MALNLFSMPALPNSGAARLFPLMTTILAALVTIVPLQIPGYAALTPAFLLMAAYHWTIYRPDLLPPFALFVVGTAEDLLTGGPIGVSALLLLLVRVGVLQYRRYFVNRGFAFVWAGFTLLTWGALVAAWALHCLLAMTVLGFRATLFRIVLTVAIFPLASFLLGRGQRALIGAG